MRRTTFLAVLAVLAVLVAPVWAAAGTLTLHPAGFGEHSYSAWKAQQGLPDSGGGANQALYFQKMTSTATIAAGVAVIKGISGLPVTELTGLAWDHREDGHCGAGAPRWNVNVQDNTTGDNYTVFLGCNAAAHTEKGAFNGHGWCRDTQPSVPAAIAGSTGVAAADLTVTGLAIVFDDGADNPNPPPAGCAQEQLAGGFVHLDNIEVQTSNPAYGTKCWTSASDNSNNSTGPCADPPAIAAPDLSVAVSPLSGLSVDPLDTGLVTALGLAGPGIPLSSWSTYPYVY